VTDEERRAARLRAEQKEEAEKLERLKVELKGRDYIYDASGGVIVMEQVQPDKLPPFRLQPRAELGAKPQAAAVLGRLSVGGKGGGRRSVGKNKIDFGANTAFKELESLQPPLLETMAVREGVTLKQGEITKGGEPRAADPNRMSRKDFEASISGGGRRSMADAATAQEDPLLSPEVGAPEAPTPMRSGKESPGQEPAARPPFMPSSMTSAGTGALPRNDIKRERGGTAVKSRLPPPMLPATVGYGLELPYPGANKSLDSTASSPTRKDFADPRVQPPAAVKPSNLTLLQ